MSDFIVKYYLVILLAVAFVLFAIIGFLADNLKKKEEALKKGEPKNNDSQIASDVPLAEIETPAEKEAAPVIETIPQTPTKEAPVIVPETEPTPMIAPEEPEVLELDKEEFVLSNDSVAPIIQEVKSEEDNKQ